MDKLYLFSGSVGVELVIDGDSSGVVEGFSSTFAGRYIPSPVTATSVPDNVFVGARVLWRIAGEGFRVVSYRLRSGGSQDYYEIVSAKPRPYLNESPYFFILQVLTRLYVKRGSLVFTDTVSFIDNTGNAVMLLGYPHTGKSTLVALALSKGFTPLTTENTIVEVKDGRMYVTGGTSILVYDPVIEKLYGVEIPVHEKTRHNYHVVDLDRVKPDRREKLAKGVPVDRIYVLHCSYSSRGVDYKLLKGRKIVKTLWYFSTALIKGVDYYEPAPLDLCTEHEVESIREKIVEIAREYSGRFYEVFGRHDNVFQLISYRNHK